MKKLEAIFATATLLIGLTIVSSARATDFDVPIRGTWSAGGGAIEVTGGNGVFEGVVTSQLTFADCVHLKGESIIKILGSGSGDVATGGKTYLGSFLMLSNPPDCSQSLSTAEFTITQIGSSFTLKACPSWNGPCLSMSKTSSPQDKKVPTVIFNVDKTLTPLSFPIYQMFKVTDESKYVTAYVRFYSDGHQINPEVATPVRTGDDILMTYQHPTNEKGPFYICVEAVDSSGNSSGYYSNCTWRSIESPMSILSNGCGSQDFGAIASWAQNWALNDHIYGKGMTTTTGYKITKDYKVSMKPACDNHDAGYQGSTFTDAITGELVDSRLKSRQEIDIKFKQDLATQCRKSALPTKLLVICIGGPKFTRLAIPAYMFYRNAIGANTYATAVAQEARKGYDSNSTLINVQTKIPTSTSPTGGSRNNKSKPDLVNKASSTASTAKKG